MNNIISRQGWIILLGVPALFISAFISGSSHYLMSLPLCAVKSFVRIDCPGCGLTRSIALLTHGHLRTSIYLHPLGVIIVLWLAFLFLKEFVGVIGGRKPAAVLSRRSRDVLLAFFIIALFAHWIIKLFFSFSL